MEILKAALLGIIQGLTEFLPVSSSGHLVIAQKLLHFSEPPVLFDITLHLATALAVIAIYYKEIWDLTLALFKGRILVTKQGYRLSSKRFHYVLVLIIALIPAGLVGYFFNDYITKAFSNLLVVAIGLFVTTVILFLSKYFNKGKGDINFKNGTVVGIAQAFAIIPGISRSGSTIFAAMASGVKGKNAADFSFLLSVPIIIGAFIFELKGIVNSHVSIAILVTGFICSFVAGYFSIKLLLSFIRRGKFHYFAYYTAAMSALSLILFFVMG
ncbi:MAG: undecaprenyl-diphosphatase [Proteobacteria bacterium]|nr:undecaprenyl-diphosphatase [Pseudomonadota bacterium]